MEKRRRTRSSGELVQPGLGIVAKALRISNLRVLRGRGRGGVRVSAASFEVWELSGGTSNVAFGYRIVTKRLGHESKRLMDMRPDAGEGEIGPA